MFHKMENYNFKTRVLWIVYALGAILDMLVILVTLGNYGLSLDLDKILYAMTRERIKRN